MIIGDWNATMLCGMNSGIIPSVESLMDNAQKELRKNNSETHLEL
jgi:hypothetical protein